MYRQLLVILRIDYFGQCGWTWDTLRWLFSKHFQIDSFRNFLDGNFGTSSKRTLLDFLWIGNFITLLVEGVKTLPDWRPRDPSGWTTLGLFRRAEIGTLQVELFQEPSWLKFLGPLPRISFCSFPVWQIWDPFPIQKGPKIVNLENLTVLQIAN